jgi:hypothetical protein
VGVICQHFASLFVFSSPPTKDANGVPLEDAEPLAEGLKSAVLLMNLDQSCFVVPSLRQLVDGAVVGLQVCLGGQDRMPLCAEYFCILQLQDVVYDHDLTLPSLPVPSLCDSHFFRTFSPIYWINVRMCTSLNDHLTHARLAR